MEELEEAQRNGRIYVPSNSRASCYPGGTDSESKETRHPAAKTLSSETLKNLCRALNDPNVSVEVKRRIGVLLRQLQRRYVERNQNSADEQNIASSYVKGTESFQAAVASGVASHIESERQRNSTNSAQPSKTMKFEPESLETFPRVRSEELPLASSTTRIRVEDTKSREEARPLPNVYSYLLNSFSESKASDSSIVREAETEASSSMNNHFVDTGTKSQGFERKLSSLQNFDSNFLLKTDSVPLKVTGSSVGVESYGHTAPVYQSLKETQTSCIHGRTSTEESSSQQHFLSSYSEKRDKWPYKREECFSKQTNMNDLKIVSGHENKHLNALYDKHFISDSGLGRSSSSSVRQDYSHQSSLSSLDKKRLRLLSAPQRDLQSILHPNYRTPFLSLEDACQRLMPYHLWYIVEDGRDIKRKQEWEASFDKVYKKLKQNLRQEEDRWKRISKFIDSEEVDSNRKTEQVIETSVLDDILASNFLLKET
ncbi:hypothetical protein GpartN1_g1199.t1 [Galdieria partita]|uniref:GLTSCR protein conserved domain-containing protein n=1 Tax=Galdieria partita TaxID=83374 RepID=A0A9C7PRJ8_9RHOD|nr:hypothetical protein GpartN1_g1199.t1 [Galdieria partita]